MVFRVGGTINLNQNAIDVVDPYLTIAGQTAPGGGIALRNGDLKIRTNDVVIRYVRFRPGDTPDVGNSGVSHCIFMRDGSRNVVIDHCSLTWGTDENLTIFSAGGQIDNISVQNSIISEGIRKPGGGKNTHAAGPTIGGISGSASNTTNISVHRNLMSHNQFRNPYMKNQNGEVINNLVFDWEYWGMMFRGGITIDIIGNKFKRGETYLGANWTTDRGIRYTPSDSRNGDYGVPGNPSIYFEGNVDDYYTDSNSNNWGMIQKTSPVFTNPGQLSETFRRNTRQSSPWPVTIHSINKIEQDLLPIMGASGRLTAQGKLVSNLDPVDQRIIKKYQTNTSGSIEDIADVGGWPTLAEGTPYPDNDKDGMSDIWEDEYGFNKNDASDGNQDADGDGYTNVEEFLNGSPTVAPPTGPTSPPSPTAELTEGTYELHPVSSPDKVVAVTGSGNGSNVALATDNDQSNQRWQFTKQANGYYRIVRAGSSKQCLDVRKRGTDNGTNVQTWRYNPGGQSNQEWKLVLEEAAKGYYSLAPRHAEEAGLAMRLDVAENSTETGANFHLWTSHGRANQRFVLEKVGGENARLAGSADKGTLTTTEDALVVYPNPTSGEEVRISGLLPTAGSLRIIDALGREVLQQSWKGPHTRMNIRSLKSGLYHIVITQQGKTTHHPLIKQ